MSNETDRVFETLDRLARDVDIEPACDPMPGIISRARANRRRATVVTAECMAGVVAAGIGLASAVGFSGSADGPRVATPPSDTTATPGGPPMADYDRARADVDGDGAVDTIRVRIAKADAEAGKEVSVVSKHVRLRVDLASGAMAELGFGRTLAPTIAGTPDLDSDSASEIVLSASGGDAAWLRVYTWDGKAVVRAAPADAPDRLVDDGGLYTAPGVAGSALDGDRLISWVGTDDTSAPYQVRVWTWRLEEKRLVATAADRLQCINPGDYPAPCRPEAGERGRVRTSQTAQPILANGSIVAFPLLSARTVAPAITDCLLGDRADVVTVSARCEPRPRTVCRDS